MDCVIKIIQGPEAGQEFHCTGLETVVGRSPRSQVRLGSPGVSFEHAVISRSGDDFYIENLSAAGTFLNDEKITGRTRLRLKDRLRIGQETVAAVQSLPATSGTPGKRRLLLIAVVVMLLILVLLVVADPFGPTETSVNWRGAYMKLQEWVQTETSQGRLPPDIDRHLENAWRLRQAGDTTGAAKEWVRLRVLLAGLEYQAGGEPEADHGELNRLVNPPKDSPELTEQEMAKALIQFVTRMEKGR